ncbi:MAG: ANTAR domain-containing protein [Humibacillus sp.]|nr:ANTAR domain-containing protein [Humibacillus sp.]MDN5775704.1 ANTAR domain-containing protein [Humibacillus sp.]
MQDKTVVLAKLARALANQDFDAPLAHRLGCAASIVVGADGAAITLAYTRDERITLCATTDLAARLEDLQEVLGQGPGAEAYDSDTQVEVRIGLASPDPTQAGRSETDEGVERLVFGDVRTGSGERRWPQFEQQALSDVGAVRMLAVPIHPDHDVLGILTFYATPERASELETDVAQFLADAVGVALLRESQWLVNETSGPWASRSRVHQATGMVIAQLQIPSEDAIALLRAHAFASSSSLLEVSEAVLRRELDFTHVARPEDPDGSST